MSKEQNHAFDSLLELFLVVPEVQLKDLGELKLSFLDETDLKLRGEKVIFTGFERTSFLEDKVDGPAKLIWFSSREWLPVKENKLWTDYIDEKIGTNSDNPRPQDFLAPYLNMVKAGYAIFSWTVPMMKRYWWLGAVGVSKEHPEVFKQIQYSWMGEEPIEASVAARSCLIELRAGIGWDYFKTYVKELEESEIGEYYDGKLDRLEVK